MFGDSSKILLPIVPGVVRVAGATVTYSILTATVISWLIITILYLFVRRTHTGRAMQAVSMDQKGAAISGVDGDRINLITWGLSGALGAIGGAFFASYTQLSPAMWLDRRYTHCCARYRVPRSDRGYRVGPRITGCVHYAFDHWRTHCQAPGVVWARRELRWS